MPYQPFKILQRMRSGPVFGADVIKHASGLPHGVNGHRGHDRGADEKEDAGGLIGIPVFKQVAESAADEESSDGGDRSKDVPHSADLTGHRMLLADHRSKPIMSDC